MSDQGATSRTSDSGPLRTSTGSRVGAVLLAVDPASAEPPFRQLKDQIVEAINRGRLTTGTRLPPVRALASDVGLSTATAAKVYRELEEAGVLEGRGRSGTFVAAADASGAVLASAAAEFAAQAAGSGFGADEAIDAVRTAFSHLD
ncbi:GntR family transcriptional regulator [Dietzia alimentaria]|uniref:GntR family transcriptional regulator n=1 Tax=Dietzia alimentaria TaxID=665550 RepID=UPI0009DA159A|nr:GntR family transcriptional regulator [Dietzia alimentaria]